MTQIESNVLASVIDAIGTEKRIIIPETREELFALAMGSQPDSSMKSEKKGLIRERRSCISSLSRSLKNLQ